MEGYGLRLFVSGVRLTSFVSPLFGEGESDFSHYQNVEPSNSVSCVNALQLHESPFRTSGDWVGRAGKSVVWIRALLKKAAVSPVRGSRLGSVGRQTGSKNA